MRALGRRVRQIDGSGPAGGLSVPFTSHTLGEISLRPVWLGLIGQPANCIFTVVALKGGCRSIAVQDVVCS